MSPHLAINRNANDWLGRFNLEISEFINLTEADVMRPINRRDTIFWGLTGEDIVKID